MPPFYGIGFRVQMNHLLIALTIALIAAAPLTYPGPLQTHAGVLPFLPEAPLPAAYLPGTLVAMLQTAGVSALSAYKSLDALAIASGVIGMFALARLRWDSSAALAAAAFYALLPYRLMTLYVRGEAGETLFWGLAPLAFAVPLWATGHRNGRAESVAPKRNIVAWAVGGLFAVVLWRLCVPHAPDPAQAQAYLFQLFSARWGDGTRGDWLDAVPLQLGIAPVGMTVIALALRRERSVTILAGIAALSGALAVAPLSAWWPWQWVFSVPWQMVGIAGFCLSLAGGSLFRERDRESPDRLPVLAAGLTLTLLASYPYLQTNGLDFVPTKPAIATFDNGITLLAADSDNPIRPGATLTVTLTWQNDGPQSSDYHVFVHALDASDRLWAQRDRPPLDGARPTPSWRRGEVLRDTIAVVIPADAPANLRLAVGMYRSGTLERARLTARDAAGKPFIADRVFVVGGP